jgi:hypothetical protein
MDFRDQPSRGPAAIAKSVKLNILPEFPLRNVPVFLKNEPLQHLRL